MIKCHRMQEIGRGVKHIPVEYVPEGERGYHCTKRVRELFFAVLLIERKQNTQIDLISSSVSNRPCDRAPSRRHCVLQTHAYVSYTCISNVLTLNKIV